MSNAWTTSSSILIASLLAWAIPSSLETSGNYRPEVRAKLTVMPAITKSAATRLRPKSQDVA